MIHALDTWKHYLLGTPLIIRIDHQSIKYFMTHTKLSNKQMRWANFLSQINFYISRIVGKNNSLADALSRRPLINTITIAHHNDLTAMIGDYINDEDFASIMATISNNLPHEPYSLKDGVLLHGSRLCITKNLRDKVMYESHVPPYAGHRGIQATTQAIETYFYWPNMRKDIHTYVDQCMECQKVKYARGKAPCLLQPLPIPNVP